MEKNRTIWRDLYIISTNRILKYLFSFKFILFLIVPFKTTKGFNFKRRTTDLSYPTNSLYSIYSLLLFGRFSTSNFPTIQ